jgi:hypothetical protein
MLEVIDPPSDTVPKWKGINHMYEIENLELDRFGLNP